MNKQLSQVILLEMEMDPEGLFRIWNFAHKTRTVLIKDQTEMGMMLMEILMYAWIYSDKITVIAQSLNAM